MISRKDIKWTQPSQATLVGRKHNILNINMKFVWWSNCSLTYQLHQNKLTLFRQVAIAKLASAQAFPNRRKLSRVMFSERKPPQVGLSFPWQLQMRSWNVSNLDIEPWVCVLPRQPLKCRYCFTLGTKVPVFFPPHIFSIYILWKEMLKPYFQSTCGLLKENL